MLLVSGYHGPGTCTIAIAGSYDTRIGPRLLRGNLNVGPRFRVVSDLLGPPHTHLDNDTWMQHFSGALRLVCGFKDRVHVPVGAGGRP